MVREALKRSIAVLMITSALTVATLSFIRAVDTIGKPFVGFFYGPNLIVAINQRASWPGIKRGLSSLERIVSVDGKSFRNGSDLRKYILNHQPGDVKNYEIEGATGLRTVSIPISTYTLADFLVGFLAPFLLGLLFLSFGAVLFYYLPKEKVSLVNLALCWVIGLFCVVLYEAYTSFTFFRLTLIYPLIGALSAHLLARFSRDFTNSWRTKSALGLLYGLATILLIWRQIALSNQDTSIFLSWMSSTYVILVLIINTLLLVRAYQRSTSRYFRDRLKLVLIGTAIAGSVIATWSLNFILDSQPFYLDEGVLFASAFPFFMGYAILRKNVFGLDRLARRVLSYAIVVALLTGLFLLFAGIVRNVFSTALSGSGAILFFAIYSGAAAFIISRYHGHVNQFIRKNIFRSQYQVARAMAEIHIRQEKGESHSEYSFRLATSLYNASFSDRGVLILQALNASDRYLARPIHPHDKLNYESWITLFEVEQFFENVKECARPLLIHDLRRSVEGVCPQSIARISAQKYQIYIPLMAEIKMVGVILLGREKTDEEFDQSDVELFQDFMDKASVAFENVVLHERARSEAGLAALGRVASVLVHDIKNPLSTIKLSAGALKRSFSPKEPQYELAMFIEEEVNRMNHTVSDILNFARPRGLDRKPTTISELTEEIEKRLQPSFRDAGIELECTSKIGSKRLFIDREQMVRALENLLVNAKEASEKGRKVKFSSDESIRDQNRVLFHIQDEGAGLSARVREKIFEPFFTTKSTGSGLGLSIVDQIVREHGGELEVESNEGKGTTFTIHLPMSPREMETQ